MDTKNQNVKDGRPVKLRDLVFRTGASSEARRLVHAFHYTHTLPSGTFFAGRFHFKENEIFDGECIAAAFFGRPSSCSSWRTYDDEAEETTEDEVQADAMQSEMFAEPEKRNKIERKSLIKIVELNRLVRDDRFKPPLTNLLSQSLKVLKRKGHDLVIAYADLSRHEGTIYRAACWQEIVDRKAKIEKYRVSGITINGKRIEGSQELMTRTCVARFGSSSFAHLQSIFDEVEPVYDQGKRLFVKVLTKQGAAMLKSMRLV